MIDDADLTRLREVADSRPANVEPSPEQWRARYLLADEQQQLDVAASAIQNGRDAFACLMRGHDRWPSEKENLRNHIATLTAERDDLLSRLGCVNEATYWDRPYDTRLAAVRGMCDLTTNGMTPVDETEVLDPGTLAALTVRAETAEATVQRLEALAAEYESDAANEGYGGELWSWTASRVRAALAAPAQTEERDHG